MGPLGLKPSEFWALTWSQLMAMLEGYRIKNAHQWQVARWQVCLILNSKIKKGASLFEPEDLIKLHTDKKHERKVEIKKYTKEEYQELKRQLGLKNG